MMGTSVLAMPWAFMEAGLVGGIVLCLANGPLAAYTAYLIDKLHKKANNSSSEFSKKKNKWSVYHRYFLPIQTSTSENLCMCASSTAALYSNSW